MSTYKPLILAVAVTTLAACATVPPPLRGNYPDTNLGAAQQGGDQATPIRWGGQIVKTEPGEQQTCFYVLQRPLNRQARPVFAGGNGVTQGRFVACHAGFYDPAVFTQGREITVTGVVHGSKTEKIGDYDYTYPQVDANVIYLWPLPTYYGYGPGWYDPYWAPYMGWGWGPYWGGWGMWGGGWGGYPGIYIRAGGGYGGRGGGGGGRGGGGGHR